MGSKLFNRVDHWLQAPPHSRDVRTKVDLPVREMPLTGCTGRHRPPPFYLRWWLGVHRG